MALRHPRLDPRPAHPPWRALPYREIQKRIGVVLRKQYEPPKDLPHRLRTLLREVDKSEDNDS